MLILRSVALAMLLSGLAGCQGKPARPLPTVAKVELQRYLGDWHEIALLPNRFQAMCVADTQAHYQLDGSVLRVRNRCRKADGTMEQADGVAEVVAGSGNAKLRVSFFWPFYGDYWILALDPDYRWALVGEPGRKYGWVLSRTPTLDRDTLRGILDQAEALGYARSAFVLSPGKKS